MTVPNLNPVKQTKKTGLVIGTVTLISVKTQGLLKTSTRVFIMLMIHTT